MHINGIHLQISITKRLLKFCQVYISLFLTNEKKKSFKLFSIIFLILVCTTTICVIIILYEKKY